MKWFSALSRLSVHMEQFGSHWTDFHEIVYLGFWFFWILVTRENKIFINIVWNQG
jgi:uncharacterized membrane protein